MHCADLASLHWTSPTGASEYHEGDAGSSCKCTECNLNRSPCNHQAFRAGCTFSSKWIILPLEGQSQVFDNYLYIFKSKSAVWKEPKNDLNGLVQLQHFGLSLDLGFDLCGCWRKRKRRDDNNKNKKWPERGHEAEILERKW